jgi:hypothetical protein
MTRYVSLIEPLSEISVIKSFSCSCPGHRDEPRTRRYLPLFGECTKWAPIGTRKSVRNSVPFLISLLPRRAPISHYCYRLPSCALVTCTCINHFFFNTVFGKMAYLGCPPRYKRISAARCVDCACVCHRRPLATRCLPWVKWVLAAPN